MLRHVTLAALAAYVCFVPVSDSYAGDEIPDTINILQTQAILPTGGEHQYTAHRLPISNCRPPVIITPCNKPNGTCKVTTCGVSNILKIRHDMNHF